MYTELDNSLIACLSRILIQRYLPCVIQQHRSSADICWLQMKGRYDNHTPKSTVSVWLVSTLHGCIMPALSLFVDLLNRLSIGVHNSLHNPMGHCFPGSYKNSRALLTLCVSRCRLIVSRCSPYQGATREGRDLMC